VCVCLCERERERERERETEIFFNCMSAAHKEKVKRLLFSLGKVYGFACFLQQPNQ